ncbi:MAG: alpha/beta hydrolase [Lachnospiraceae bacterium]|nr:alpha/beta hydrolase [Lachnospiraceae bacterium]
MISKDLHYLSADKKTKIHFHEWLPEGYPKAVIQIAHGITEHIGRYEQVAGYLVEEDYAVVGNDHLGHGTSIENKDAFMCCDHWEYLVKDAHRLQEYMKQQYPTVPYYVVGFSLGSFVMRDLLARYPESTNAAILIDTGMQKASQISFAGRLVGLEAKRIGAGKTSRLIQSLSFGTYNRNFKPNRTEYDWLCEDEEGLADYIQDDSCGKYVTAGLFRELLRGMMITGKTENIDKIKKELPILLLSGAQDPVGEMGKGVERVEETFQKAGILDISMKLYPGRHDILHEACKEQVLEDMTEWLEQLYWQEYLS